MMPQTQSKTPTPAVAYIRMSSDQQAASPERQRSEIQRLAQRDGFEVVRWYEDHGLTGTESRNRPEFQKMIADADTGAFQAILMYEQSRFSREDIFDVIPYWGLLQKAGVRMITVQSGEIRFDDLGGLLTAIVGQHGARAEALTIAQRGVSGKRQKLARGHYLSGNIFGYDRVYYDETGQIIKRVHFREKFRKTNTWRGQLLPSLDTAAVEAVKHAFQAYEEGQTISHILRYFQKRQISTTRNKPFCYRTVERMLQNPIYTGRIIAGRYSNGKFSRIDDDGLIVTENSHPALVSLEQFDEVQAILNGRRQSNRRADAGTFLLSHKIYCQTCGSMFHCLQNINGSGAKQCYYRCSGRYQQEKTKCLHPTVTASDLERVVLEAVTQHLLTDENLQRCWAAHSQPGTKPVALDLQPRMDELRSMVETGQRNLALAARPEDFAAISDQVHEWKSELRKLQRQSAQQPKGDAHEKPLAISKLKECRDGIEAADRVLLAVALEKVIERITVKRHYTASRRRITTAQIVFKPDVYFGEPIEVPDQELTRRPWRIMAQWVIDQQRLVSGTEISQQFDCNQTNVSQRMKRALESGLVQNVHGKGWAAAELELNQTQWRDVAAWVRSRKFPTTVEHVVQRFELHTKLANAHLRYGVENGLLKKIGMRSWVSVDSEMKSTDYADVIGWVRDQQRICSVEETAREFCIGQAHV